ncbi:MAG: sigma 54-interacting transcriptional regulator [Syntrophomonas sp.]
MKDKFRTKEDLISELVRLQQRNIELEKERRQIEEASDERFYRIFNSSPSMMAIQNIEDEHYIDVNEKWLNILGFSRSEIKGRNSIELNLYVDPEKRAQLYWELHESERARSFVTTIQAKSGDIVTLVISSTIIQLGKCDYILMNAIDITDQVLISEELRKSRQENAETQLKLDKLKKFAAKSFSDIGITAHSAIMRKIVKDANTYHLDRSIPVLIEGETGTGKELVAKLIHYGNFDVIEAPFIDINCAAITPGIFESEMFGYDAGSFTGGLSKGQKGKFDLAQGGTLFLDEIAEIPYDLQGKLLRVIQEKELYRVGGLKKIKTDVRIICATNVDLEFRVCKGTFREDLYYRIKVGYIKIPPLRERKEAILPLASKFLLQASKLKGKSFRSISPEAAEILQSYSWPGNIREMKNVIDSIVLMHDYQELKPVHLEIIRQKIEFLNTGENILTQQKTAVMEHIIQASEEFSPKRKIKENISLQETISQIGTFQVSMTNDGFNLDTIIDEIINRALYLNNGNKTETARYLGISRTALYNRLKNQDI